MINVKILARTQEEGRLDQESKLTGLKTLGGKLAGICYMPDDYLSNAIQDVDNANKRADMTANNGHHSVFDHGNITLLLQGVPKMIAMLLNSTQVYTTSEKSARYTMMAPGTKEEQLVYEKWTEKLTQLIQDKYSHIDEKAAKKLAQENARYMISVFTPTVMAFTASYRQLNYLLDWCNKLVASLSQLEGKFNSLLKGHVEELMVRIMEVLGEKTVSDNKDRYFEFLPLQHGLTIERYKNTIGDVYSIEYYMSLAALAQAHRHRTLNYQMLFTGTDAKEFGFYIPKIIREQQQLVDEWVKDITSVADCFPQGTMVKVIEQGLAKDFFLKCKERLCGRAQLEVMNNTLRTIKSFKKHASELSSINRKKLDDMTSDGFVPKCGFNDFKCKEPCAWGLAKGLTRDI